MKRRQVQKLAFHLRRDECQHDEVKRALITINYLITHFPDKKDLLDLGTGRGFFVAIAVGRGLNGHGVDLRDWRYEGGRTRFTVADARNLPFPDASFDVVTDHLLTNDIEMLQKLSYHRVNKVYQEAHRVLRPNGIMIKAPKNTTPYRAKSFIEQLGFSELETTCPNISVYRKLE